MPEPDTRPSFRQHLLEEDEEEEEPAMPEAKVDERPTFREHLLDEEPTFATRVGRQFVLFGRALRTRARRITFKQWIIAATLFLGTPAVAWGWEAFAAHKEYEAALATMAAFDEEEAKAQTKASAQLTQNIIQWQGTQARRKIAAKATHRWKQWSALFLGDRGAFCTHSNNFAQYPTTGSYNIKCQVGPKGKDPVQLVSCNENTCKTLKLKPVDSE